MGLFGGEKKCASCGKKAGAFSSVVLGGDKSNLCATCAEMIPEYMRDAAKESWSIEDYKNMRDELKRSSEELVPAFKETYSYGKLHVDEENGLFYFAEGFFGGLSKKTLVLDMRNIYEAQFIFNPVTVNSGLFSTTVTGEVHMVIQMLLPIFLRDVVLTSEAKGKAKSNTLGTKVDYYEPEDMALLRERFVSAARPIMKLTELQKFIEQNEQDIAAARGMFMLGPDEPVDRAKLEKQYGRLVKSFEGDEASLAKVEENYRLLLNQLE